MTWEIVLRGNEGETKVNKCLATRCKHNKHKICMKSMVEIGPDAKCKQYSPKDGSGTTLKPNPRADFQLDTDEYSFQQFHEA